MAAKPTKTEYTVGDTFSADGLKVVKVMSDKTEPGKKPGAQKPAGQQNVCPRPVPRWLAWPVCVPMCAPKRRSCALKNANRAICVLMFAHLSFRRAHRNANRPYLLLLRCCAVTPLCRHAVVPSRRRCRPGNAERRETGLRQIMPQARFSMPDHAG